MKFFEEFRTLSEERTHENRGLSTGERVRNPVCGDEVCVAVELEPEGRIANVKYFAEGCWPVYGCLEWLAERFEGSDAKDALGFSLESFLTVVKGVPAGKRHAFSLSHRAFRLALLQAIVGSPAKERL